MYRAVAQLVARLVWDQEVVSSNLTGPIGFPPRAARMVGTALRQLPSKSKIPWWRVINSRGMISIENLAVPKPEQARYLQVDGIKVKLRNGNYWVDLKKYLWKGGQVR